MIDYVVINVSNLPDVVRLEGDEAVAVATLCDEDDE